MTISSPLLFIRPLMCHVPPAPLPDSLQGQSSPRPAGMGMGMGMESLNYSTAGAAQGEFWVLLMSSTCRPKSITVPFC